MARPSTRKRKTALVPRLLLSATFISVVPACALSACGGPDPLLQLGPTFFGVAAVAFDAFSVADIAFRDVLLGVADAAFTDASDAADAPSDVVGDVSVDAPDDAID